jgi:hypothetical protein
MDSRKDSARFEDQEEAPCQAARSNLRRDPTSFPKSSRDFPSHRGAR